MLLIWVPFDLLQCCYKLNFWQLLNTAAAVAMHSKVASGSNFKVKLVNSLTVF